MALADADFPRSVCTPTEVREMWDILNPSAWDRNVVLQLHCRIVMLCESVYELLEVFVFFAGRVELSARVLKLPLQRSDARARDSQHALRSRHHFLQRFPCGSFLRQLVGQSLRTGFIQPLLTIFQELLYIFPTGNLLYQSS